MWQFAVVNCERVGLGDDLRTWVAGSSTTWAMWQLIGDENLFSSKLVMCSSSMYFDESLTLRLRNHSMMNHKARGQSLYLPIVSALIYCRRVIVFMMTVGGVNEYSVRYPRWTIIVIMPNGHREELIVVRRRCILVGERAVRTRRRWDDVVVRIQVIRLITIPTVHASPWRSHSRGLLKGRKRWCGMNCLSGDLRWWTVVCVNVAGFARRFTLSPFRSTIL